jgi:hypothetical protein
LLGNVIFLLTFSAVVIPFFWPYHVEGIILQQILCLLYNFMLRSFFF